MWGPCAKFAGQEGRIAHVLGIRTNHIVPRTLILFAAIAIPLQSFPATSCGCTRSGVCPQQGAKSQGCCGTAELVRGERCCCVRPRAESGHSCCDVAERSPDSGCTCEFDGRCGKAKREPATPSVAKALQEKFCDKAPSTVAVIAVHQPRFQPRRKDGAVDLCASTSLDRCARFCRFTL